MTSHVAAAKEEERKVWVILSLFLIHTDTHTLNTTNTKHTL